MRQIVPMSGGVVMLVLPSGACADGVVGTQLGAWQLHFIIA